MASEVFNLAILLSLKDAASGGLDQFSAKLRTAQKDGKQFTQTFENLREEMNKGLAIGGIGLASLALLGKGVQVAGNFQSTMTDLRTTLSQLNADGKVNLNQLGADMQKAESIAMKLGNALPGTTEDFIQMMQILKQNGLETQTIMNGAANAVGNLAVANNALPKDVAKDFAQFGQLFKLKPDEYIKAADTVSRLYTSAGIGTGELIEGLKYFQGRAGAALGITGLKDAEQVVRVMGLLRKQGLEGSTAGTSFNNLFMGFLSARNKKDDPIERLKQLEGINIKLFDDKGSFAGIDNLFKQLEPLQKLTEEKRLSYLKEIFGEEGMSAATAILKTGADGWRVYNEEQNKTISLQQKNAEKAKDFNNQLEALTGSAKNLVVTAFEPMLPSITNGINSLNSMVGSLQQFGKENPVLVKTLGTIALYGSTAMVVVGSFKALTSAWKLFQLATTFSSGGGLVSYLNGVSQSANTATTRVAGFTGSLDTATKKATGLRGAMQTIANSSALKIGVQVVGVMAAEIALTSFIQKMQEVAEESRKLAENSKEVGRIYDSMLGQGLMFNAPGDYQNRKGEYQALASQFLESAKMGRQLYLSFHPDQASMWERWNFTQPYGADLSNPFGNNKFKPEHAVSTWKEAGLTKSLHDINTLAQIIAEVQKGGGDLNLDLGGIQLFLQALEKASNPVTWKAALDLANKEKGVETTKQPTVRNDALFQGFAGLNKMFPQANNQILNPLPQTPNKSPVSLINPASTNFFNSLDKPITTMTMALGNVSQPANDTSKGLYNLNSSAVELPPQFQILGKSTDATKQSVVEFGQSLSQTQTPLTAFITGANNASGGLNSLAEKLMNWNPPTPQVQTINVDGATGSIINAPSRAIGGVVERDGIAQVHAGNVITPAKITKGLSGKTSVPSISYSPQITINGGDKKATKEFRALLYQHKKDLERIVAERMNNGRVRS